MDLCWQSKASAFKYAIYVGHNCPSITSWQIDGEIVTDFIFGAPKSLQMVTTAMTLKDTCSLEEKL